MASLLLLGFLIGMRHALEADHVAAVATLATRTTTVKQAIKLGSIWGLGHTLTLFLFGSVVLLTDLFVPEAMAAWLEFSVGIMLILLGLDVLRRLIRDRIHYHVHQHEAPQRYLFTSPFEKGGSRGILSNKSPLIPLFQRGGLNNDPQRHFHAHSHTDKALKNDPHQHQHPNQLYYRALFVGILHGMAGSAALILLTLETIKSPLIGIIYIALFGFGSIAGMAVLSYAISIPLRASATGMTRMHNGLQLMIGVSTVIVGSSFVILGV